MCFECYCEQNRKSEVNQSGNALGELGCGYVAGVCTRPGHPAAPGPVRLTSPASARA